MIEGGKDSGGESQRERHQEQEYKHEKGHWQGKRKGYRRLNFIARGVLLHFFSSDDSFGEGSSPEKDFYMVSCFPSIRRYSVSKGFVGCFAISNVHGYGVGVFILELYSSWRRSVRIEDVLVLTSLEVTLLQWNQEAISYTRSSHQPMYCPHEHSKRIRSLAETLCNCLPSSTIVISPCPMNSVEEAIEINTWTRSIVNLDPIVSK